MRSSLTSILKSTQAGSLSFRLAALLFALTALDCSVPAYSQALTTQQAMQLTQEGKFQEAKDAWAQLAELHPTDFIAQANLGLTLAHLGQYQDAVGAYRKALALRPHQPEIELNLGLAEFKQGNFTAAISSFNSAATAKTPDPRLETLLGMSYYGEGQFAK